MPGFRLVTFLFLVCVCSAFAEGGATNAPLASLHQTYGKRVSASPELIQGTVTFVDAVRKRVVLQEGSDVAVFYTDLADDGLTVGMKVELEAVIGPFFTACPRFPYEPDGRQIRDSFEAPSDWAEQFLSRLRGMLHPPASGDYTFWIASDDSSELWLSDGADPAGARRIAQVPSGRWTEPRLWTRLPSQKSATIRLEAGQPYYLEAMGQDTTSRDSLAVAWQGPGFERSVIDGKFITPWRATEGDASLPQREHGALWEYWTNFHSTDFSVLQEPDAGVLKLTHARILKRESGELPKPVVIREGQPLEAGANFRRVELDGRIQFLARAEDGWLMELECGRATVTARIRTDDQPDFPLPIHSLVRVSGFFEPTRSLEREAQPGTLWVNGSEPVVWLDTAENWSLIEEMPQHRLTATNPELSVGRTVRTQGRVTAQEGAGLWRLAGKDTIRGYTSADGTNWSSAGAAIELNLSHEVLVGFAISSHRTGELATAEFDHVSGLSAAFSSSDVGNPPLAGRLDDLAGVIRVRGSGDDIWHQADQCFFAHQKRAGDFQIRVRLAELRASDSGAKVALMVRESLARNSPWAGVAVLSGYRVGVQGRLDADENAVGALTTMNATNNWFKLVRQRNSFLVRTAAESLSPGQMVEVLGEVGWQGQELVVEKPRVRSLAAKVDGVVAVPPSEPPAGDPHDVPIAELAAEVKNAQRSARLSTVRIRGVVTFNAQVGNEWHSFVQDQGASVRIRWRAQALRQALPVGDWVELTGTPALAETGVELTAHGITRLGSGEMPAPFRFQLDATKASVPDGRWTELEGVGRPSSSDDRLLLLTRDGEVEVFAGSLPASQFTNWVNARILVRGVLLRRPGPALLLPAMRYLQMVEPPPPDPFGIPVYPVQALQAVTDEFRPARRLKVSGAVTCRRGDWLVVQDKTGGVRVESKDASTVQVGDEVEAVGFPTERGIGVVLSDALLRPMGRGQLPAPAGLEPDNFVHLHNNGTLISVEAVLLAQHRGGDLQTLDVQSGQRAFQANLPASEGKLPPLAVGSRLRLAGVAVVDGAAAAAPDLASDRGLMGALELLLRSPDDVVVVERPPWWNWKHTATTIALGLAVFVGAVIWIRTLRRRVEARTHELRETMGKLQRETQISATLAERDRLAAEIHDSVEQGLSAIMMQMEAATMVDELPEVKRHLAMARNMAGFSRQEVQNAVWDLQSPLLENADLVTALRRVAQDISAGDTPRVTLEVSGTVFHLASKVEHHLLRIAQEAITNAVKHGGPKTISLTLQYGSDALTLTVRDDGGGFVPEMTSTQGGHFGLQGMRARASKIKADLMLGSKPGEGTCVQITVPRGNLAAPAEPTEAEGH